MKKTSNYFFSLVFLLTIVLNTSSAKDDLDIIQLRKDAQSGQTNKQGLKYSLVDVQEKDGKFFLKYDLNESADFEYEVRIVFVRERDQQFYIIPKLVSGAIGEGKFAGRGNSISWDYKKDYPKPLDGDDFYFILVINRIEPSNVPWTWIGVGTVAVAGATYFILNGNKDESNPINSNSEIPALNISRPN
jgi:hypothetical protein